MYLNQAIRITVSGDQHSGYTVTVHREGGTGGYSETFTRELSDIPKIIEQFVSCATTTVIGDFRKWQS